MCACTVFPCVRMWIAPSLHSLIQWRWLIQYHLEYQMYVCCTNFIWTKWFAWIDAISCRCNQPIVKCALHSNSIIDQPYITIYIIAKCVHCSHTHAPTPDESAWAGCTHNTHCSLLRMTIFSLRFHVQNFVYKIDRTIR